jgi:hypothetical protein
MGTSLSKLAVSFAKPLPLALTALALASLFRTHVWKEGLVQAESVLRALVWQRSVQALGGLSTV